jgi:hypothetical protein
LGAPKEQQDQTLACLIFILDFYFNLCIFEAFFLFFMVVWLVWSGLVWSGLVWSGLVWSGLV